MKTRSIGMKSMGLLTLIAAVGCGGKPEIVTKNASYHYVGPASAASLRNDGLSRITILRGHDIYESDGDLGQFVQGPMLPDPVLFNSPGFDHTGVIGNDERNVVADSQVTSLPFSPNITVNWTNAQTSVLCSATFVSLHDAVTAAHCVFDAAGGGGGTGWRFFNFAAMGSNVQQHYPTAGCIAAAAVPTAYVNTNNISDFKDDYAVLDFQGCGDNLGQYVGHLGLGVSANIGTAFVFADGYPEFCGCSGALMLTGMCNSASTQPAGQAAMTRQQICILGQCMFTGMWQTPHVDMTKQESGMGVYYISGGYKLIGTGIGKSGSNNYFRDFDQTYYNFLAMVSDDF